MRHRIATPFFSPSDEGQAPLGGPCTPQDRSARALEGRTIENGRYLLLRKLHHSERTVHFSARDMHGGGLLVELILAIDSACPTGYRLRSTDVTPAHNDLPDLYSPPITLKVRIHPRRRSRLRRLFERNE